MGKNLRFQDRLLLGLALMGEVVADTVAASSKARRTGTLNFWSPPGYIHRNYRETIWRMLKTEKIERVIKSGQPYLRLANKGEKRLERDFPLLRWQKKKWDGKWRLVIFDIEERNRKSRDALRWKLLELGFGQLQKSIYISPHDIGEDVKEFLEARHYSFDEVVVLEARQKVIGDPRKIAEKVWQISKLEARYLDLEMRIDKISGEHWDTSEGRDKIRALYDTYFSIITADPFLPQELLPPGWPADEVREKLSKITPRS